MKHRMSRPLRNRQKFKAVSLLEKINSGRDVLTIQPGYINLTFLGFKR